MASRILLTGGSGDLGTMLSQQIIEQGDIPVILDVAPPQDETIAFIQGSITERDIVAKAMQHIDMVIHIAAWHGVHESSKTADEFYDLNVTGTYNMIEAAAKACVKKFIFISSTSISKPYSLYGHTKILGEEMMTAYADRHNMDIVTLRPRAFIPSWNRQIYPDYLSWAKWFWRGAVHIDDVAQAVMKSITYLKENKPPFPPPALPIDGKYDYAIEVLDNWDKNGAGSSFKEQYPDYIALAEKYGFDLARKPKIIGSKEAEALIGYQPSYSLQNMLDALKNQE